MLEEYIGRDSFRKAIREFIRVWRYKHPTPYDLFAILKKNTNKDIDWIIDAWFFEPGWPDLAIGKATIENQKLTLEIENKGTLPVPIVLTIEYSDGSIEIIKRSIEVWKETNKYSMVIPLKSDIESVHLDCSKIPDKDCSNNKY